jgi:CBS domain-containing protein
MTVSHILKTKGNAVVTASPADTLEDIAKTLAAKRIGAVIILDGAKIAGILSERDVVRAFAEHGSAALALSASKVMTEKVFTCGLQDSEAELMGMMTVKRIRHLPVVQDGKLVGMISIGDVVKNRMEAMEREAEEMKAYIASAG